MRRKTSCAANGIFRVSIAAVGAALAWCCLALGCSTTTTLEGPVALARTVSTAVSPALARQGQCSPQLEVRSFEWGPEVESHPELKVTNVGDAEIRQAFFYYDVYDGRGTRLTTLMSEAKAIQPGETARTHARFRPSGDEARCELVRIITMP